MTDYQIEQIVQAARASANGNHGVLSTGEGLAAALIRNRPDLLGSYTIIEAINRVGEHWMSLLPAAARQFEREQASQRDTIEREALEQRLQTLSADVPADTTIDANAALVTWSHAPGYRTCSLVVDVTPLGGARTHRLGLNFATEDSVAILDYLHDIHRTAWRGGEGPIDRLDGETRPTWV